MKEPYTHVPEAAKRSLKSCPLRQPDFVENLEFRDTPYWHTLLLSRHIGIYRPNDRVCTWTARYLDKQKKYRQRRLGPALDTEVCAAISLEEAVSLAFEWFQSPEIERLGNQPIPFEKTSAINCCPIGETYTVGHALKDYTEWTSISRSSGGHYNNLVLINYHLVPNFSSIALEDFTAQHLSDLARQVLETPPKYGFQGYAPRRPIQDLLPDELRRRKRTFNSLVTILRMAFRHAWENGHINSERPWRCLRRIAVNHSPRTIFLDRVECRRLMSFCTPALKNLVQAALYTGCRVGELGALRVEDVGHQIYGIRVDAFKRSPARYVFLPDEGMAFFLSNCEGKSPRDRVFLSDRGKVWRKQHTGLFRRAVARAGLPTEFVFHGLRHTYASDLVRQGVSLDVVAKQLGHASSVTVSNTYGHLAEQFRESQIRNRFSPLDPAQQCEIQRRQDQLQSLWRRFQRTEWREYGRLDIQTSEPKKTYTQTHKAVLEVFNGVTN